MSDEFEIIKNPNIAYLNLFVVNVFYRRPHYHRYFEICLLLEGTLEVISREGINKYQKNDIFIFNPDQVHELRSPDNSAARILSLQISYKLCEPFFPLLKNLAFSESNLQKTTNREDLIKLREGLIGLGIDYFTGENGYELLCAGKISILLSRLIQKNPYRILNDNEKSLQRKRIRRINSILEYIDENFSGKILLSDIAEREQLSLSYLSHFFKENLQVTFEEYVSNLRFEKAKILLAQTEMNILEVSLESGFPDSRYLNKIFLKKLGYSVRDFKDKFQAGNQRTKPTEISTGINPKKREGNQFIYSERESLQILREYK